MSHEPKPTTIDGVEVPFSIAELQAAVSRHERGISAAGEAFEIAMRDPESIPGGPLREAIRAYSDAAEWEPVRAARSFDLVAHLHRQRAFSERTFGPGQRTAGVLDHIRKELAEIEADPLDISEWIDVVLLAFDGAWRHGHTPESIAAGLAAKQAKNEARTWPDWRTQPAGKAIEHDRSADVDDAPDLTDATPLPPPSWMLP